MPIVPKPGRHIGAGERYQGSRQRFLADKAGNPPGDGRVEVMVACECSLPGKCPRAARVVIERALTGEWHCSGDVDHVEARSRRPDLRDEWGNLRVLSRWCHRFVKDHNKKAKREAAEEYNDALRALAREGGR